MRYILFLFTIFISLYANDKYSIVIKKPFNEALFDVTQDYDRSISVVGFVKKYKQNQTQNKTYTNPFEYLKSLSNSNGTQMALIKLDDSGGVIFEKSLNLNKFNKAIAVVKTPKNGYFVGGYTQNGELLIAKFGSSGDAEFIKTFGTKNYDQMSNLILLSDGGVLAIGTSSTTRSKYDDLFETGLGLNDIYLTRFSKDGKKLWSKKYGTAYDDRGIDAVEASDGSFIVVGTTSHKNKKDVILMRIGENGDKIWLTHYNGSKNTTPYKIIRLKDENFLVSLSFKNDLNQDQIRLVKFDIHKNILIDTPIDTTYTSVLKDIKEFSDGNIVGVGYVRDMSDTDALIMILDGELNMLYQDHFGDENYDTFNAVDILHNSQIVAVGSCTDKESQESNMWIVKLNHDGSLATKKTNRAIMVTSNTSSKNSSLHVELVKLFDNEIKNKTLSVSDELGIYFLDKRLYFKKGSYSLSKAQKVFLANFTKKLIPFLQKHNQQIKTLEINGHTSSEWNNDFGDTYLKNAKLSLRRSYAVLSFIFNHSSKQEQHFLTAILKGGGWSYAKAVLKDGVEDRKSSRRVVLKIIPK